MTRIGTQKICVICVICGQIFRAIRVSVHPLRWCTGIQTRRILDHGFHGFHGFLRIRNPCNSCNPWSKNKAKTAFGPPSKAIKTQTYRGMRIEADPWDMTADYIGRFPRRAALHSDDLVGNRMAHREAASSVNPLHFSGSFHSHHRAQILANKSVDTPRRAA